MKMSSNDQRMAFTFSPSNSDLEELLANNEDNLMQNLLKSNNAEQATLEDHMNYIFETPLFPKR
eukprot:CAMPEP_0202956740 /NCGR_PEP_ID=MMETSP1396-20130829/1245_1 /ASSEMBLY_ACC=CAM_ASM_000872 /TAXON_ID= /ORGANISM="Pseudokeronopsis sp., Strain Brazil" /LENGTH=63 /DNA_ID=CAMNT_0049673905 /DNA_START=380 /DNA_END=571 /DNA_ORIENTATION=+